MVVWQAVADTNSGVSGPLAKKKSKSPSIYRNAATGRFVTKKYAKKHPKKTVREYW
jgi:hypothetical protein